MEKLLSGDELGELVGVSTKTLADWRARGLGPAYVRIGRHVRYRPADVEAWIGERAARTAAGRASA